MSYYYSKCRYCAKEYEKRSLLDHEKSCVERPDAFSPLKSVPDESGLKTPTKKTPAKSKFWKKCQYCDYEADHRTVKSHMINCLFQPKLTPDKHEKEVSNNKVNYDENSCSLVIVSSEAIGSAESLPTNFSLLNDDKPADSSDMSVDDSLSSSLYGSPNSGASPENEIIWPEETTDTEEEICPNDFNELEEFIDENLAAIQASDSAAYALSLFLLIWALSFYVSLSAVDSLLCGIGKFFDLIRITIPNLAPFSRSFPRSKYGLEKALSLNKDTFETLAVCESCHTNYKLNEIPETLRCSARCGTKLGRWLKTRKGRIFRPFYTFAYRPLSWGLQDLLLQSTFETNCNLWRDRKLLHERDENVLYDIHDGALWNSESLGKFCHEKNNYLFLLNFDFFPPYERSTVSIGCLYCVCLNLPIEIRFKKNNWLVLGILPWIGGEPSDLSPYFQTVVDNLLTLWNGVEMVTQSQPDGTTIRGAILGSSSDMPATRKLLGFKTFHAHKGCSKCTVHFGNRKSTPCTRDWGSCFSQLNPSKMRKNGSLVFPVSWAPKTGVCHRKTAADIRRASSKKAKADISQKTGYFENIFLQLPYNDSVRMHTIDPMHCLFEGVAKHVFEVWTRGNFLSKAKLEELDKALATIKPPPDFDRLPTRISNYWRLFKAVQWMHWVLHYSPLILTGQFLPQRCLDYWFNFVDACRAITVHQISRTQLMTFTDNYLIFVKKFINVHGIDEVVPNMHMAMHLENVILDYGPVYSFWLFPFERYNGILGSYPNNGHPNVECQLMRRFLAISQAESMKARLPNDAKQIVEALSMEVGINILSIQILIKHQRHEVISSKICSRNLYSDLRTIVLPDRCSKSKLNQKQRDILLSIYQLIYGTISPSDVSEEIVYYSRIVIGGEHYWSRFEKNASREAIILVKWRPLGSPEVKPATVLRFFHHSIVFNGQLLKHVFASVMYHPSGTQAGNPYTKPAFICRRNENLPCDNSCFVPVQHIFHRTLCKPDSSSAGSFVCVPLVAT